MKVYISGPITKDKGYYQKFLNAESHLRAQGLETVNPARVGRLLPKSFTHGDYMDVDYILLQKCDCIYMLKGWNASIGAKNELSYAKEHGIKVLYQTNKNDRIEVE